MSALAISGDEQTARLLTGLRPGRALRLGHALCLGYALCVGRALRLRCGGRRDGCVGSRVRIGGRAARFRPRSRCGLSR